MKRKEYKVLENTYIDNELVMTEQEMWSKVRYYERILDLEEHGMIVSNGKDKDGNLVINIWL